MSPIRRRRSSCSRRWALSRPHSGITICWSAPTAQALSKRDRTLSIAALREEGIEALAVATYSALIGTSDPVVPHASLDELARGFDFAKLSRAPARFDPNELRLLNAKLLHMLPFAAVEDRLLRWASAAGEEFWEAVRGNLAALDDAKLIGGRW